MLLSIVMMVKNEEKFLEKTLKSFSVLMDKIKCELIILDTGSTDNTINIAKKYTDKVYFEKWNDNFADMRNKSISYAKGKWILVLDADEELVEFDKLIEFITDKKYDKYDGARIKIKNIKSDDKKNFSYVKISRIFKRDKIRYEGLVHEQSNLNNIYKDVALVNHFGYMFDDEEEKNKKLKRNEKLLLRQLEINPDDAYSNYQMAKNLVSEGKIKDAIDYMEKCIKEYGKYGKLLSVGYQDLATMYIVLGENKKAEELCKKYIEKDKNNIDIYFYLAEAQVYLGKFKSAIESFERFIYLSENYEMSTQSKTSETDYKTENYIDDTYIKLARLYYNQCDYEKVLEIISKLKEDDKNYQYILNSLININKLHEIENYYNQNCISIEQKNSFYYELERYLNKSEKKIYNQLVKMFSKQNDYYGYLNACRIEKKFNLNKIKKILNEEESIIYAGFLNLIDYECLDLMYLFENLDSIWIKKYLYRAIEIDKKIIINLYKYALSLPISFKIDDIRIYKIILKSILDGNGISIDKYKNIYFIYNMYCYIYVKLLYNNMSDDKIIRYSMNEDDKFSVVLTGLIKHKNKKSIEYINKLRKTLKDYPIEKKIIEILINDIDFIKDYTEEYYAVKSEFIQTIGKFIENSDYYNAKKLIEEYYIINGEDSDILNTHGVLCILQNNLEKANKLLTKSMSLDIENEDVLYNIKYLNSVQATNFDI